jgi:hypothetical protein
MLDGDGVRRKNRLQGNGNSGNTAFVSTINIKLTVNI